MAPDVVAIATRSGRRRAVVDGGRVRPQVASHSGQIRSAVTVWAIFLLLTSAPQSCPEIDVLPNPSRPSAPERECGRRMRAQTGIPALDLWWPKSRALLAKAAGNSHAYDTFLLRLFRSMPAYRAGPSGMRGLIQRPGFHLRDLDEVRPCIRLSWRRKAELADRSYRGTSRRRDGLPYAIARHAVILYASRQAEIVAQASTGC